MKNYEKPIAEIVEFQPEDKIMGVDFEEMPDVSFGNEDDF